MTDEDREYVRSMKYSSNPDVQHLRRIILERDEEIAQLTKWLQLEKKHHTEAEVKLKGAYGDLQKLQAEIENAPWVYGDKDGDVWTRERTKSGASYHDDRRTPLLTSRMEKL